MNGINCKECVFSSHQPNQNLIWIKNYYDKLISLDDKL